MPTSIDIAITTNQELYDHGNIGSVAMISEQNVELSTEDNDEIITEDYTTWL
jgi:hypothetical protein